MQQRLQELGYTEVSNIVIEYRASDDMADRLPQLAADLVKLKVDAIVTTTAVGVQATKQATATIPIIMAVVDDAGRVLHRRVEFAGGRQDKVQELSLSGRAPVDRHPACRRSSALERADRDGIGERCRVVVSDGAALRFAEGSFDAIAIPT